MTDAWNELLPDLLASLKMDIPITTTAYDTRLTQYIQSAYEAIEEEGITLDAGSMKDQQLVMSYAEWMWRRRDKGEGMPRMIRYAMNNRLFSQKMRETN